MCNNFAKVMRSILSMDKVLQRIDQLTDLYFDKCHNHWVAHICGRHRIRSGEPLTLKQDLLHKLKCICWFSAKSFLDLLRSEVGDSWNSQARKMEPHTVSLDLRMGNSVKIKHLVKMSSDIQNRGFSQIPDAWKFSDINMSSSETLTAQDWWLDTYFFAN